MESTQHIILVSAVNFDQVMDDTDQISIRRGASLMLRQAPKDISTKFPRLIEDTISTGASNGIYLLKSDVETEAVAKINEFLRAEYPHLTFVVVSEPYVVVSDSEKDKYSTTKDILFSKAKLAQLKQLSLVLPELNITNDKAPICAEDHLRPTVLQLDIKNVKGEPISLSCHERFNYGRIHRKKFYFDELKGYEPKLDLAQFEVTDNLQELANHHHFGNLNDKIALIYFDGTKFGNIQKKHCKTIDLQKDFDNQLQNNQRSFLSKLVSMAMEEESFQTAPLKKSPEKKRIRLETLMWGGDEVLLIVPAWQGMAVMQLFFDLYKEWRLMGQKIKYDGGIVFCSNKTPITHVRNLARDLADSCKEYRKENRQYHPDCCLWDYLVLESVDYPCDTLAQYFSHLYNKKIAKRTPLADLPTDSSNTYLTLIQSIKQRLSKRQLYALAKELTSPTDKEIVSPTDADINLKSLTLCAQFKRMQTLFNKDNDATGTLQAELAQLFPAATPEWHWLHLLELYDYLAPSPITSSSQEMQDSEHQPTNQHAAGGTQK